MNGNHYGKYYQLIVAELGEEFSSTPGSYELRYECDKCRTSGNTYLDRKLYVNSDNLMFDCKRCGWSGRFNLARDLNVSTTSRLEIALNTYRELNSTDELELIQEGDTDILYKLPSVIPSKDDPAVIYLESRGVPYEKVLKYGMRVSTDLDNPRFSGRIVIPNKITYEKWTDMYTARAYGNREPKYLNPKNSPKNRVLYNYHNIPDNPEYIIVFEGVLEVITHDGYGVATYGKSLSRAQIELLKKKNPKNILLCWDYDAHGGVKDITQYKTDEALESLSRLCPNSTVWWVVMPPDIDASDEGEYLFNSKIKDRARRYVDGKDFELTKRMISAELALKEK